MAGDTGWAGAMGTAGFMMEAPVAVTLDDLDRPDDAVSFA
jgi:hypothetical protein